MVLKKENWPKTAPVVPPLQCYQVVHWHQWLPRIKKRNRNHQRTKETKETTRRRMEGSKEDWKERKRNTQQERKGGREEGRKGGREGRGGEGRGGEGRGGDGLNKKENYASSFNFFALQQLLTNCPVCQNTHRKSHRTFISAFSIISAFALRPRSVRTMDNTLSLLAQRICLRMTRGKNFPKNICLLTTQRFSLPSFHFYPKGHGGPALLLRPKNRLQSWIRENCIKSKVLQKLEREEFYLIVTNTIQRQTER